MRTIKKIAKAELNVLFYSPVAWLVLIIFTVQASMLFTEQFDNMVRAQSLGRELYSVTKGTFSGYFGFFTGLTRYLYLYIPLLTMGVMSRELSSGSIKLLFSSPIKNRQIIIGKYLALVLFALILTALIGLFALFAFFSIDQVDSPVILSGLLGLFLLVCAYAAIGLFMSSITTYTVVAAIGTLAILAFLNYIKGVGQDVALVRDITYWLALSGRVDTFISGAITCEDLCYFLLVIILFLSFAILKLRQGRQDLSFAKASAQYILAFVVVALAGYISTRPRMMKVFDVTRNKTNTLSANSQKVMALLKEPLSITTYTNMLSPDYSLALPDGYNYDVDRFRQYLRFKPDIRLDYSYYYHHTDYAFLDKQYPKLNDRQRLDTMQKIMNWKFDIQEAKEMPASAGLASENYRFVRVLKLASGRQTYLRAYDDMMRYPSEAEITAAVKRLVMDLPTVGFVTGHGERSSLSDGDRGYHKFAEEKTFRYALINQGFDFKNLSLDQEVPASITVLIIADPRKPYTPTEIGRLKRYLDNGGSLVLAGDIGKQDVVNPLSQLTGVTFVPGILVHPSPDFQADLMVLKPTAEARAFSFHLDQVGRNNQRITMPGAVGLNYTDSLGYKVTPLLTTDSLDSWNEMETTNFIDDTVLYHPAAAEVKKPYPTALALERDVNGKNQRILVTGDADWLSNGELGMFRQKVAPANYFFINAAFFWLSHEEVPIDTRRDPSIDNSLSLTDKGWAVWGFLFKWLLPLLLATSGIIIWIRRKGR